MGNASLKKRVVTLLKELRADRGSRARLRSGQAWPRVLPVGAGHHGAGLRAACPWHGTSRVLLARDGFLQPGAHAGREASAADAAEEAATNELNLALRSGDRQGQAVVTYIKEVQGGHGVCAVSYNYAVELKRERALFGGIRGLGPDVVTSFLQKHDMDLVCRAHQVVEDGYEFFAKRQLITIFSVPNYCGEFDNAGAMMTIDETLMCSFKVLKPVKGKK